MDERDEFERWARNNIGQFRATGKHIRGGAWAYSHNIVQLAWQCWQARATSREHHLLEWLSKEDHSAYGECKGRDLDRLIDLGLARVCIKDQRGQDFNRVQLTDAGYAEAKRLGEWVPQ